MNINHPSRSSDIRNKLAHPVIDTDGHMVEVFSVMFDYLKQVGGPDMTEQAWVSFRRQNGIGWYDMTAQQRRYHNQLRPAFWAAPAKNTLDRATAMLPKLMHERLPEMGIDYSVVYPTIGFLLPDIADTDVRAAVCRAHNLMMADMFRGLEDRLTPAAVIPCHTPAEAIAELEFAINELGLKVPMFANLVKRPVEAVTARDAELGRYAFWVDTLALDSVHDYDPVWQKCMDLKVSVTAHAISQGIGLRRSVSNYMYNQTGHFAEAGQAFAKALFFGGVTRRFPDLNFAFLEGGVAWGASLVCDLKERWEKRNAGAIQQFNPEKIDTDYLLELFDQYGGEVLRGKLQPEGISRAPAEPQGVDEFAAAGIDSMDDFLDRLVPNFFYGCEADDRMNAVAFDTRILPGGRKLGAVFSSDFGHWDVPDMREVVAEAYQMVEKQVIGEKDFRAFVFANPVRLFTGMNPQFFAGTAIEDEVAVLLGEED